MSRRPNIMQLLLLNNPNLIKLLIKHRLPVLLHPTPNNPRQLPHLLLVLIDHISLEELQGEVFEFFEGGAKGVVGTH